MQPNRPRLRRGRALRAVLLAGGVFAVGCAPHAVATMPDVAVVAMDAGVDAVSPDAGAGTDARSPRDAGASDVAVAADTGGGDVGGTAPPRSAKRGVAYDLASPADLAALSPGITWWYNWAATPNAGITPDAQARYDVDYLPMIWNGHFDDATIVAWLHAHPSVHYMLVLNEPNLTSQSNATPADAATLWPRYESVAAAAGVQIVGPAMTWGNMPGYADPAAWLDAFIAAYRAQNGGRAPRFDYLAFHWYDYGLAAQLDRLDRFGKPIWVTEFANTHGGTDGAQIDTLAKQETQMREMVATLEARADVFRYAWFTGRWPGDTHFASLLGAPGVLTDLGREYLTLPF